MVDNYSTLQDVPCCCRTDIFMLISTEMYCLFLFKSCHFYIREVLVVRCLCTRKMKVAGSFEILVPVCHISWCHIHEDYNSDDIHSHHYNNHAHFTIIFPFLSTLLPVTKFSLILSLTTVN
jgi:hypothetical protein